MSPIHSTQEVSFMSNQSSYHQPLSQKQEEALSNLIEHLASKSVFWLMREPEELKVCKENLKGLHPLNFILGLAIHPERKNQLAALKNRGAVFWGPFITRLDQQLKEVHLKDDLEPHIDDFANKVALSKEETKDFVLNSKLKFLFDKLLSSV